MAEAKQEIITIHRVQGIARREGIDDDGQIWLESDTSGYLDVNEGSCEICGEEEPADVFVNLDMNGDMVCADHVEICCYDDDPCDSAPQWPVASV